MPSEHILYDLGYNRQERLEALTRLPTVQEPGHYQQQPVELTMDDLEELFETFQQGSADAGTKSTLIEFAAWIMGKHIRNPVTHWFEDLEPAEVVW